MTALSECPWYVSAHVVRRWMDLTGHGHDPASFDAASDDSAQGQNRTVHTGIFSPLLYQLSYLGSGCDGRFVSEKSSVVSIRWYRRSSSSNQWLTAVWRSVSIRRQRLVWWPAPSISDAPVRRSDRGKGEHAKGRFDDRWF